MEGRMELRHIRYFMAIAEELNFTKAAEKLNIAQPPLSRQIKDLEEELGAPLFIRKAHNLQLTEEGRLFMQYASQILELANKSMDDIGSMNKGLHGKIYIATVEGHVPHLWATWISGFSKLNPNVEFDLWTGTTDEIINRIHRGLCELAIVMEPFSDSETEEFKVYKEPWAAIIPASDDLASDRSAFVKPSELIGKPLIIPSRQSRLKEIQSWIGDEPVALDVKCRVANLANALELARLGVGISIFPFSADILGRDDSIVVKKIKHNDAIASYLLIKNKNRQLSKAADEFLNHIRTVL